MKKFWEGVLAFGPLICLVISIACIVLVYVGLFVMVIHAEMIGADPEEFSSMLLGIFGIVMMIGWLSFSFITIVFSMIDMFVFCVYACTNPNLDTGMKVLWCFLFAFFSLITCPIYWCIYKSKEKKLENIHKIPY
ncbi:MAG: hypothetical protein J6A80_06145 [Lachnospiraceae bacterium]|nr:hypothetical protein [Lachnospiraceae bacterium]